MERLLWKMICGTEGFWILYAKFNNQSDGPCQHLILSKIRRYGYFLEEFSEAVEKMGREIRLYPESTVGPAV